MRKLLIALVIILVALVAADRIAVHIAQRKVASRVAAAYSLARPPSVTIQGFPFLTQLVAGNYQQVDISLASVVRSGVDLRNLQARFDRVHAPLRELVGADRASVKVITADHAAATALIPFPVVQRRLPRGITLSQDGGGELRLSGKLGYQGLWVPVTAAVGLRVTGNAIEVVPHDVIVGGALAVPPALLGSRLAFTLPVHDLPMHLKMTRVRVTAGGFEVSAAARDVAFESRG